jgi:hypothetical protein
MSSSSSSTSSGTGGSASVGTCKAKPGSERYCVDCGPCKVGQGLCFYNSDCEPGLTCKNNYCANQ